jgi:hypothetical protein
MNPKMHGGGSGVRFRRPTAQGCGARGHGRSRHRGGPILGRQAEAGSLERQPHSGVHQWRWAPVKDVARWPLAALELPGRHVAARNRSGRRWRAQMRTDGD